MLYVVMIILFCQNIYTYGDHAKSSTVCCALRAFSGPVKQIYNLPPAITLHYET
jgi:hypothetical protein